MSKHLRVSILIGAVVAGLMLFLFASGWLEKFDQHVYNAYALKQKLLHPFPAAALFLAVFFAFVIAWTTIDISSIPRRIMVVLGAVLACWGASWVASLYGIFIPPFLPTFTILLSAILGGAFSATKWGRRKCILEELFGRRITQSQFNQLVDSQQSIFSGSRAEGTVVVVAVQNRVALLEAMSPEDYVAMTNFYFRSAAEFFVETGGYLEQCDGESMRILFGVPIPDEQHAIKACRVALDLRKRLDALNLECDYQWERHIEFRIGIHSGPMVAAVFDATRLGGFSVSGEAPDLARKLASACSIYGCHILTTNSTFEKVSDTFELRPLDLFRLRDSGNRQELYELLALKNGFSTQRGEKRDHFWKGIIYFRERKFDQANEEFSLARIKGIPDPVLDYYIERIERAARRKSDEVDAPIMF